MKLDLLHIFMVDFSKGWGVRRHSHPYYQIWFVIDGEALYYLRDQEIMLKKGDMVFLPPETAHELPVMEDGLLRYVDVKFTVHDAELARECEKIPLVTQPDDEKLQDAILRCREFYYEQEKYSKEIARLLLEQAVLQILGKQEPSIRNQQLWMPAKKDFGNLKGVAADIVTYINNHYNEEFDLERLSASLRYNRAYLCKLFKDATGMTIINYLNYVRISRAYDLICYTSHSISNIALIVGFSSVHYFTRMFKKVCGMPPGEVRSLQKDSILRDMRLHGNFNYRYHVDFPD